MKKILSGAVVVFVVALMVSSAVVAKNNNSNNKGNDFSNSKAEKMKEFKDFEKPSQGKSNAAIHKEKIEKVSKGLKEVAEKEKNKGQQKKEEKRVENKINNPDVGEQTQTKERSEGETEEEIAEEIEEIAEEAETAEEETAEAMEKVEQQNKFKKLLVGTDYKNLGQLRSSLVQNRNQIRKLTAISETISDEEVTDAVNEQLTTLMQERERIKSIILKNESGFSILGWAFRLINGYSNDSIDEEEEQKLEEEVADAVEDEERDEGEDEDEQEEDAAEENEQEVIEIENIEENLEPVTN